MAERVGWGVGEGVGGYTQSMVHALKALESRFRGMRKGRTNIFCFGGSGKVLLR